MKLRQKALLISLEGIDGAGKSTQINNLCAFLSRHNLDYVCFREPGGTLLGEQVRALLKSSDPDLHIEPLAELLLFSAARVELLNTAIKPALAAGKIVILDRFVDSTLAYQGGGRALPYDSVATVCDLVLQGMRTDRTYYLRLSREAAVARIQGSRDVGLDRMDKIDDAAFWQNIIDVYEQLAKRSFSAGDKRICVVDAALEPERVTELIIADLLTLLTSAD